MYHVVKHLHKIGHLPQLIAIDWGVDVQSVIYINCILKIVFLNAK